MDFTVTHRFARITPRKARYVADLIRSQTVDAALQILRRTPRRAAGMVDKVVRSAVANAAETSGVDSDSLYVSGAWVNEGPRMRRGRPGPRGMWRPYKKSMCHITVVVSSEEDEDQQEE